MNSLLTEAEKWDILHEGMDEAYSFMIEPVFEKIRILQSQSHLVTCDIVDLFDEVNENAKDLFMLCRTGMIDLEQIYKGCHKKSGIRPVFKYLKSIGWTRKQIMTGINDLRRTLNY